MDDYFEGFGGVRDYLRSVVDQSRARTATPRRSSAGAATCRISPATTGSAARWPSGWRSTRRSRAARRTSSRSRCSTCTGRSRRRGMRSRMLLQVHDELVLEVAEGERAVVEELVRREMGAAHAAVGAAGGVGRLRTQLGRRGALTTAAPPHIGAGPAFRCGPCTPRTARAHRARCARAGAACARPVRVARIRWTCGCTPLDDAGVEPLAWDDPLPAHPRRILVTGTSGAGKTTVAAALSGRLGDPAHRHRRALPRSRLGAAPRVRRRRRRSRRARGVGHRVAVLRGPPAPAGPRGPAGLARPDPRDRDAPDRAADAPPAAAARRAVERQRRTTAVDAAHRSGPHPALGLAHPPQDRRPRAPGARLDRPDRRWCGCATAAR